MHERQASPPRFYRAYYLNGMGGIQRAEVIEANDDEAALRYVREKNENRTVEIWDRARFIGKVEAERVVVAPEPQHAFPPPVDADARVREMARSLFMPEFPKAERK